MKDNKKWLLSSITMYLDPKLLKNVYISHLVI